MLVLRGLGDHKGGFDNEENAIQDFEWAKCGERQTGVRQSWMRMAERFASASE